MEKAESVRGVKSGKPPIKSKPIVPTKPKHVSVATPKSAVKKTLLSSNAQEPCSPTLDILSAVKISQLTGPQPYGTRRASLKRWSSTVEEMVPESNELRSLAETSVPNLSTKIMTQHVNAHVKSLQTGSVWKGKSPFILTTRGWGEQRWSQGKDDHESESSTQRHSFSLPTQDVDEKKEHTLVDLSPSGSSSVAREVDLNINLTEENPLLLQPKDVYRHNEYAKTEHLNIETLITDEQDAPSEYQQASWSPLSSVKEEDCKIPHIVQGVKEHLVSYESQLTDCSTIEHKIHKSSHENKENTNPSTATMLHTAKHNDFRVEKTNCFSVAPCNSNKPIYDHQNRTSVGLTSIQSLDHTMEPYEHYSKAYQVDSPHIYDDNKEKKQNYKNRKQETDRRPHGEYVDHPASTVMEKQREHCVENRLVHEKIEEFSHDTQIPYVPVLAPDSDTILYKDPPILENYSLLSGEGNIHTGDKSSSHMEWSNLPKTMNEINQMENYDPNRSGQTYCDCKSSSLDLNGKVTHSIGISDNYKQASTLQYYKPHSTTEHQIQIDKLETNEPDELQCTHTQTKEDERMPIDNEKPNDKNDQSDAHVQRYAESETLIPDHVNSKSKESQPRYEQSEKTYHIYDQLRESGEKAETCQMLEASVHKDEQFEEPYSVYSLEDEASHKDKQSVEAALEFKPLDQSADKYDCSNELVQTHEKPEMSGSSHELIKGYRQVDDIVHISDQLNKSSHTLKCSDKAADNYEQPEESVHRHQKPEEPVQVYKGSEEKDNRNVQPEKTMYKHAEELGDNYIYSEQVHNSYQQEKLEDPALINAKSEDKSSDHTQQGQIYSMSLQQQSKQIHLGETHSASPISVVSSYMSSKKDHILEEKLKPLKDSYLEVPKYKDTLAHEELNSEISLKEQGHGDQLTEEPHVLSIHEQATNNALPKEILHLDGLPEKSATEASIERPNEPGDFMPETENQEDKYPYQDTILNINAKHGDLQSVDKILEKDKENKDQELQEIISKESPVQNFDFLEGTVVLDSSYIKCRASLGRKRSHRTPAAGSCASEEEKDSEYWMFRDSTETKNNHQKEQERDEEEKTNKDQTSRNVIPNISPSPEKSLKKGGIFAGIMSQSILKGRLKSRSKTTEGEDGKKEEAEESKSSEKENPESSSSLNWLHALKKRKKKQPK